MASLKSILPKYLQTSRLCLELFDYSDAHYSCLLAAMNSPTAHKNMGDFGIRTPEAFDKLNSGTRLSSSIFPMPVSVDTDVYYLVHLTDESGPLLGGVSVTQRGNVPPDMGWCMLEEYHGRGYATEAAKDVLRMVREDLGVQELIAWPSTTNIPSNKVALRVGFVEGGKVKDESGKEQVVYILPGMQFDHNVKLSLYGE